MSKYPETKRPGLLLSMTPLMVLIFLLVVNILIFKDSSTSGPNQIALLLSGVVSALLGCSILKVSYKKIETEIVRSIGMAVPAMIILLVVGAIISIWIASGIVPTMIYYGLKTLSPQNFLPLSCLICAIVALTTGSSWSTSGTVGIALIGVGITLKIPEGMVAGAVISGAYFGDKLSPLSDTTNMAPAVAGTDIFSHIRHMLYTTIPALLLALTGFIILGFNYGSDQASISDEIAVTELIRSTFNVGWFQFIVPALVLLLIVKKVPALPALLAGCLAGIISMFIFQKDFLIQRLGDGYTLSQAYEFVINISFGGFSMETSNELINSLFSKGGMKGMLNTLWLILSAMVFGGTMEATGMLSTITNSILSAVKKSGSLVGATLASCITLNLTASDQYLAIVVPGKMFKKAYQKFELHPKNLSRTLEDGGTVTSVLIPWNSGGAYHSSVLGVPTLTYLPYCLFNIFSPIVSLFIASAGWTLEKELGKTDEDIIENNRNISDKNHEGGHSATDQLTTL